MITAVLPVGGGVNKSENADPPEQASRLIIEWTADL